jgi:hypothetical protein
MLRNATKKGAAEADSREGILTWALLRDLVVILRQKFEAKRVRNRVAKSRLKPTAYSLQLFTQIVAHTGSQLSSPPYRFPLLGFKKISYCCAEHDDGKRRQ